VLRELGNTKYISFLDSDKRNEKNKKFEGVTFVKTDETKTILGYDCKKVIAKLKDGSTYNVYYAPAIIPSNRDFEYQFKDLPGFVLEYESEAESGKSRIKYSASKITLTPVASAKFDVPKSGYRIL
jgi:GLPGLI family protein